MRAGVLLASLLLLLGAGSTAAAPPHPYDTSPVWSPDGRRILFDRDSRPYVVNRDGTGLRRLLDVYASGSWSPDGRRIVLATYVNDGRGPIESDLYVVGADGAHRRRITSSTGAEGSPRWSPDGRTIAFARGPEASQAIWLIRPDGTGARRLARGSRPEWSPDGRRIVFTACAGAKCARRRNDVFVMDADGRHRRRLTWSVDNAWPAWSPDGRWITYAKAGDHDVSSRIELFAVRPDGAGRHRLLEIASEGRLQPAWSRDARRLVVVSERGSYPFPLRLWAVRSDGGGARLFLRGRAAERTGEQPGDADPAWSPDGRELAFVRLYEFGEGAVFGRIHVVRADGTHARRIT